MSAEVELLFAASACGLAGVAGICFSRSWLEWHRVAEHRQVLKRSSGVDAEDAKAASGFAATVVRYLTGLSRKLSFKATRPLIPSIASRKRLSEESRLSVWFAEHVEKAGLAQEVTLVGFCEARVRLALGFAAVGGLVGAVLSNELALILGVAGAVIGGCAPRWALRAAERQRTVEVERHLSEMLEVVALGLRSGLSFDRSFQLYSAHFTTQLAHACASAQRRWSMGLSTREESLRLLADSYASVQLARVVENMVRSLRFGSSLAESLEAAAAEARLEHRAHLEEVVAKAPVKMMMPTGALILPAMLLLVLGPVLLELGEGF